MGQSYVVCSCINFSTSRDNYVYVSCTPSIYFWNLKFQEILMLAFKLGQSNLSHLCCVNHICYAIAINITTLQVSKGVFNVLDYPVETRTAGLHYNYIPVSCIFGNFNFLRFLCKFSDYIKLIWTIYARSIIFVVALGWLQFYISSMHLTPH